MQEEEEETQEQIKVEKILGYKKQNGKMLYYVKWANLPEEENTWEQAENLTHSQEIIDEYNKEHEITDYTQKDEDNENSEEKKIIEKNETEHPPTEQKSKPMDWDRINEEKKKIIQGIASRERKKRERAEKGMKPSGRPRKHITIIGATRKFGKLRFLITDGKNEIYLTHTDLSYKYTKELLDFYENNIEFGEKFTFEI